MRHPVRSLPRYRGHFLAAALIGFALAGCVDRFGKIVKGGQSPIMPHTVAGSDFLCEQELPFDSIYPSDWKLADGLSADQQRNRYYQKCMARLGHPEQTVAPPAPAP